MYGLGKEMGPMILVRIFFKLWPC